MSSKRLANRRLAGTLRVPGDKSITHRALIFATLASGTCRVSGMSPAEDCASSAECLRALGLTVERTDVDQCDITSSGPSCLKEPGEILYAGNSGTTMRLLSGILAGQPFRVVLDGDGSLRSRPMSRVLDPLTEMGADISYLDRRNCAPFAIRGAALVGKQFDLKVASAQVQTAILLAGLQAEGQTIVRLPSVVRDHTMRMFKMLGVPFSLSEDHSTIGVSRLERPVGPFQATVPADISSAAFFMVAAACLPGSDITLTDVGLNPGRDLVIEVLTEMGADITVIPTGEACGEPIGIVRVKGSELKGTTIGGDRLARGIDEVPALAVAGALCNGIFRIEGGTELRVKESDRITAIVSNLQSAGASVHESEDGFLIEGRQTLAGGATWKTFDDHRMAMSGMIASAVAQEPVDVDNKNCVGVSYPNFAADLARLLAD